MFGRKKQALTGIQNELPKDFYDNLTLIGYVFEYKLGEGSFGSVYRCHLVDQNGVDGEDMAVKHINLSEIYEPKYREPRSSAELALIKEKSRRKKLMLRKSSVWRRFKARLGFGSRKHLKVDATPDNAVEESAQNIHNELNALFRANHPNVVRMYNTISDEDSRFGSRNPNPKHILIFTELANLDLYVYKIRSSVKVTTDEAKDFSAQIIRGLAHLHSEGIAHLDLKADNILVFYGKVNLTDITLKITDFGLALLYPITDESSDKSEFRVGTPNYADPLLIRTWFLLERDPNTVVPDIDFFKADVWSYGCIVLLFFVFVDHLYRVYDQNYHYIITNADHKLGDIYISELRDRNASADVVSFLTDIFGCDQTNRKSAAECGRHVWISSELSALKQRFPSQRQLQ